MTIEIKIFIFILAANAVTFIKKYLKNEKIKTGSCSSD
jgi:hypothetical protein